MHMKRITNLPLGRPAALRTLRLAATNATDLSPSYLAPGSRHELRVGNQRFRGLPSRFDKLPELSILAQDNLLQIHLFHACDDRDRSPMPREEDSFMLCTVQKVAEPRLGLSDPDKFHSTSLVVFRSFHRMCRITTSCCSWLTS